MTVERFRFNAHPQAVTYCSAAGDRDHKADPVWPRSIVETFDGCRPGAELLR